MSTWHSTCRYSLFGVSARGRSPPSGPPRVFNWAPFHRGIERQIRGENWGDGARVADVGLLSLTMLWTLGFVDVIPTGCYVVVGAARAN